MKFFIYFLFACFFGGILLQRLSPRALLLVVLGISVVVSIGYYYFDQI